MNKLEKLKKELSKCDFEIIKHNKKRVELLDKISLEEQKEIQKLLKSKNLSIEDLKKMLD